MDKFEPMKKLLGEAFSFKKYKALPLPIAIIIGILLFPAWLIAAVLVLFYYCGAIVVALLDYPIEAFHAFVRNEGKEVRPAAEVFVYIFGWPVVLFFKFWVLVLGVLNYVFFFLASIVLYFATLCGVKIDPEMKAETERDLTPEPKSHQAKVKGIVVLVILAVFMLPLTPILLVLVLLSLPVDIFALIFLFFGTHLFDKAFQEKPKKEKKPVEKKQKEVKKEEPHVEEKKEEPVKEEAKAEPEPAPAEEAHEEAPAEEVHEEEKKEEHFDFSSLDEYNKNRHPADDYQAERLDDLADDYDRR